MEEEIEMVLLNLSKLLLRLSELSSPLLTFWLGLKLPLQEGKAPMKKVLGLPSLCWSFSRFLSKERPNPVQALDQGMCSRPLSPLSLVSKLLYSLNQAPI